MYLLMFISNVHWSCPIYSDALEMLFATKYMDSGVENKAVHTMVFEKPTQTRE